MYSIEEIQALLALHGLGLDYFKLDNTTAHAWVIQPPVIHLALIHATGNTILEAANAAYADWLDSHTN